MTPAAKEAAAALLAAAIADNDALDEGRFADVEGARKVQADLVARAAALAALVDGSGRLDWISHGGIGFEVVRLPNGDAVLIPRSRPTNTAKSRRRRAAA